MDQSRRRLLLGAAAAAAFGVAGPARARPLLVNPCRGPLPDALARHAIVEAAWTGIDPQALWDCHVHIAGSGDSGSGIEVSAKMASPLHPKHYVQRLFYMNAGCANERPGHIDESYVERLRRLADGLRPGARLVLLAFERWHDESGRPQPERSTLYVPDLYARTVAAACPERFEWACSIHPYRPDCVDALEAAVGRGARAVKWLPSAMGIDPASPRCDRFYAALARVGLPLLTHAGEEQAVEASEAQDFGNPLKLRRALDQGVKVIVAHCASLGEDRDLDRGARGPKVPSFTLFARLMDDARYAGLLHGDISAITQRNRSYDVIRQLLLRSDWHGRLLQGSDYPLPGVVPLVSPRSLARAQLLPAHAVPVLEDIRAHNPLLFDFVLKRELACAGRKFSPQVFDTRRHLRPQTA